MKNERWMRVGGRGFALVALLAAGAAQAIPVVSSHIRVTVPTGASVTQLFTFPPPDDCPTPPCTDRRVMIGKFLVNEPTDDLSFELLPTVGSTYTLQAFTTSSGFHQITENGSGTPAMIV